MHASKKQLCVQWLGLARVAGLETCNPGVLPSAILGVVPTPVRILSGHRRLPIQQANADTEAVKAAIYGIYAALSERDMRKMETFWVHDENVVVINVPNKVPSIGWDACKKNWEAVINSFSKVSAKVQPPHIHFIHGAAAATTAIEVHGTSKDGQPESLSVLATQIFVKHGERWLAIAHHASVPG